MNNLQEIPNLERITQPPHPHHQKENFDVFIDEKVLVCMMDFTNAFDMVHLRDHPYIIFYGVI